MTEQTAQEALALMEALFERMVTMQQKKVLRLAREAVPNITPEEVRNPHDFPELKAHPTFEFEDGLLSGLVSAQVAVRTELRRQYMPPLPPGPSAA